MNRLLLAVVLADNCDIERAKRTGKLLSAAVQRAIDDLVAAGIVQRGEYLAAPEPTVHLEMAQRHQDRAASR